MRKGPCPSCRLPTTRCTTLHTATESLAAGADTIGIQRHGHAHVHGFRRSRLVRPYTYAFTCVHTRMDADTHTDADTQTDSDTRTRAHGGRRTMVHVRTKTHSQRHTQPRPGARWPERRRARACLAGIAGALSHQARAVRSVSRVAPRALCVPCTESVCA